MIAPDPKVSKIYYAKPSITELEVRYAADAAANGWGEHGSDYINRFEKSLSEYVGTRHAVATSSATGALHLGLAALGIGPGDEVILADTNWIASVAPVVHLGATPVFVDILPDTWCLDPARVEAAITSRTKAIIAVHLYGNLCDMDKLEAIAAKHKLFLIEDAAEAVGARWGNRHAGSRGVFGFFSFHSAKTVTTGEGGALVTSDDELYEKVLTLNNHGRVRGEARQFWGSVIGYKYKMSNLQAALGCAQMERVEELVARRREIFFLYKELLADCPGLSMNPVANLEQAVTADGIAESGKLRGSAKFDETGQSFGYWMPTVIFSKESGIKKETVLANFKNANIEGRAFFSPLSLQAGFTPAHNEISYDLSLHAINLPSYHDLTAVDQNRVAQLVKEQLR
ncbi:MAG: DegT/DnrJ/EryC1/StrS family aminotransferase [Deltaproteobacteria bacterium]|nr:DegT/DnrJ/EryC1/StrS family aminotransferase [Deltaproteobacteria bacterium]